GVPEDILVPVGRVVEHDDLVAFDELDVAQHGVGGDGAAHPDDGGAPAHDLVDAGGGDARRVRLPECPLLGVGGHGQQAVADGVAGRLVARHNQQNEEGGHLGVGERLAVDVGVDQSG